MKVFLFCCSFFIVNYASPLERCSTNPLTWQNSICCQSTCPRNWAKLPLLLVSMDGFRADYLLRDKTPSLQSLIECGSHAPFMYPSYPSKTFPNHYTIVTGLYPESHGIIDNTMYDPSVEPQEDRYFSRPDPSAKNAQWWHGEPIWNTVNKHGMKSATYFWPGTEAKIQNMSPTYFYNYNASTPFYLRVDQVIEWLLMDSSDRPDFLTVYFDQPDHTGHLFGPDSPQVTNELVIVDAFINYLMRKLFENNLLHCVNMILLADHGMQTLYRDFMRLSDYIPNTDGMQIYAGPLGRIMLGNSSLTTDQVLESIVCKYNHSRVFKTEETPTRFHYTRSKTRQGEIIIDMDPGYTFFNNTPWKGESGDHGFDYKTNSMHALFLAYGPKFKQNYTLKPFQNIELYNLFADTLDIPFSTRASTNGTVGRLHEIFINPPAHVQVPMQPISTCDFHQQPMKQCGYCSNSNGPKSCAATSEPLFIEIPDNPQCIGFCITPLCQATECGLSLIYWKFFNIAVLAKFAITRDSMPVIRDDYHCSYIASGVDECPNPWQFAPTFNAKQISLYSLDYFNEVAAKLWYGKVPMYNGFYTGAWLWLQNLTLTYAKNYSRLLIMNGAIFDYDANGLADDVDLIRKRNAESFITIPSHYYQILLRCDGTWTSTNNMCSGELHVLSFILPHTPKPSNCLTAEKYLSLNTGRIRDIELLTGLQFFSDMNFTSVQLRTQINQQLW